MKDEDKGKWMDSFFERFKGSVKNAFLKLLQEDDDIKRELNSFIKEYLYENSLD